jgi:hypothetical protein
LRIVQKPDSYHSQSKVVKVNLTPGFGKLFVRICSMLLFIYKERRILKTRGIHYLPHKHIIILGHFPPTFRYVLDGLCRWSILYKQRTSFLGWGNIRRYVAKKLNFFLPRGPNFMHLSKVKNHNSCTRLVLRSDNS